MAENWFLYLSSYSQSQHKFQKLFDICSVIVVCWLQPNILLVTVPIPKLFNMDTRLWHVCYNLQPCCNLLANLWQLCDKQGCCSALTSLAFLYGYVCGNRLFHIYYWSVPFLHLESTNWLWLQDHDYRCSSKLCDFVLYMKLTESVVLGIMLVQLQRTGSVKKKIIRK